MLLNTQNDITPWIFLYKLSVFLLVILAQVMLSTDYLVYEYLGNGSWRWVDRHIRWLPVHCHFPYSSCNQLPSYLGCSGEFLFTECIFGFVNVTPSFRAICYVIKNRPLNPKPVGWFLSVHTCVPVIPQWASFSEQFAIASLHPYLLLL